MSELVAGVNAWFERSARDLPWRRSGFSAWGSLVSEFMLQQTPVNRVIPHLEAWLERWPTPAALAGSSPGDAVRAWSSLGYPRRALRLHACAVAITQKHGGVVPHDVDELLALPGVGDYTARAIAVFAYGKRHPVVDTNIRRVIARVAEGRADAAAPSTRRDLAAMSALLPEDDGEAQRFNAGMMELGAIVCTARAPRCEECPIAGLCAWRARGKPPAPPRTRKQPKYEGSDRQARGRILAELRDATGAVPRSHLAALLPDAAQRDRAIAGLVADGLAVLEQDLLSLP